MRIMYIQYTLYTFLGSVGLFFFLENIYSAIKKNKNKNIKSDSKKHLLYNVTKYFNYI